MVLYVIRSHGEGSHGNGLKTQFPIFPYLVLVLGYLCGKECEAAEGRFMHRLVGGIR